MTTAGATIALAACTPDVPVVESRIPTGAASSSHAIDDPLAAAVDQDGSSYTLESLPTCRVGDGLAVLANRSTGPITIRAVHLAFSNTPAGVAKIDYSVQPVRSGHASGEIAGDYSLDKLGSDGLPVPAVGATLRPDASSSLWYVVVAHVQVGPDTPAWGIRELDIEYAADGRVYEAAFPQDVNLPATSTCSHP